MYVGLVLRLEKEKVQNLGLPSVAPKRPPQTTKANPKMPTQFGVNENSLVEGTRTEISFFFFTISVEGTKTTKRVFAPENSKTFSMCFFHTMLY